MDTGINMLGQFQVGTAGYFTDWDHLNDWQKEKRFEKMYEDFPEGYEVDDFFDEWERLSDSLGEKTAFPVRKGEVEGPKTHTEAKQGP